MPICVGETLVRPAQISNQGYGKGVVLQKVTFEEGKFSFEEIKRLYSPLKHFRLAFHTFNNYNNEMIVVDAQGFLHPRFWGPVVNGIANFVKRLLLKVRHPGRG